MKDDKHIEKILREGAVSEFWEIIKEALDENIENVDRMILTELEDLEDMPAEEFKIRLSILREKKKHYAMLKGTPYLIVQSLGEPEKLIDDLDVYDKKEDFLNKNEEA